jgi:quercetin dioxygenase-like cupin family protein
MSTTQSKHNAMKHGLMAAAFAAGAFALLPAAAQAGSCPADKMVASGQGQQPGAKAHKNVTDKVLTMIELGKEKVGLKDHQFRLRRLVVQPGGEVAWHSHADRPAIIYIVSGTITEYASTCAVPIVHKAGDVARETHTTSHWWKNSSSKPAVLLSADILHEKDDPHTM